MEAPLSTKPIRRVLKWQAGASVAMAALVVSAVVMGISMRGISNPASAGGTVAALFRAEASKILLIVLQLCLVMLTYRDVVPAVFFGSFVITVLLFPLALLERN